MSEMGMKGPLCLPKRCFSKWPLARHLNWKEESEAFTNLRLYSYVTFAEDFEFTWPKLLQKKKQFVKFGISNGLQITLKINNM